MCKIKLDFKLYLPFLVSRISGLPCANLSLETDLCCMNTSTGVCTSSLNLYLRSDFGMMLHGDNVETLPMRNLRNLQLLMTQVFKRNGTFTFLLKHVSLRV